MFNIVCIKWGQKYGPEFVNILYSMVKRNLTVPYRFICFTENSKNLNKNIEIFPLNENLEGWWHKLTLFKKNLFDLSGKTLYLDLDVIIVNPIDQLFYQKNNFIIIKDWFYSRPQYQKNNQIMYNSSVFLYNIGSYSNVWDDFEKDPEKFIKENNRGDQEWITKKIPNASFWPKNWCRSFKWSYHFKDLNYNFDAGFNDDTKIIVFHGRPNPPEAINGWKQYPPQKWINKYWRE